MGQKTYKYTGPDDNLAGHGDVKTGDLVHLSDSEQEYLTAERLRGGSINFVEATPEELAAAVEAKKATAPVEGVDPDKDAPSPEELALKAAELEKQTVDAKTTDQTETRTRERTR